MRVRVWERGDSVFVQGEDGSLVEIAGDGKVFLRLVDGKRRMIGLVEEGGRVFYKRESRADGIHRKTMSIGFPFFLLAFLYKLRGLERIVVDLEGERYVLDVEKVIKDGRLDRSRVFVMDVDGYERRAFIPLSCFEKEGEENEEALLFP